MWWKKKKISPRFKRYVAVGVSVYLFELAVIVAAQAAGASAVVAVGLSFWLGLFVSFGMQKIVAFQDKRTHHKILIPQFLAFTALVLFNFGFTLLVAKLLDNLVPAVVSRSVALGITTIWNFYLYKTRIFSGTQPLID